jgi:hypothetical protein
MPPTADIHSFRLLQEGPRPCVSLALDNEDVGLYVASNDEIYEAAILTTAFGLGVLGEQDTAPSMVTGALHKVRDSHLK